MVCEGERMIVFSACSLFRYWARMLIKHYCVFWWRALKHSAELGFSESMMYQQPELMSV